MSHVVTVDFLVTDLEALERACDRLGWKFLKGQKTFSWYGRWMDDYAERDAAYLHGINPDNYGSCDHAIKVPGADYEIGVVSTPEGYKFVWDSWESGGLSHLSQHNPLHQMYAVEATKLQAERQGLSCQWSETVTDNGNILLEATLY